MMGGFSLSTTALLGGDGWFCSACDVNKKDTAGAQKPKLDMDSGCTSQARREGDMGTNQHEDVAVTDNL